MLFADLTFLLEDITGSYNVKQIELGMKSGIGGVKMTRKLTRITNKEKTIKDKERLLEACTFNHPRQAIGAILWIWMLSFRLWDSCFVQSSSQFRPGIWLLIL